MWFGRKAPVLDNIRTVTRERSRQRSVGEPAVVAKGPVAPGDGFQGVMNLDVIDRKRLRLPGFGRPMPDSAPRKRPSNTTAVRSQGFHSPSSRSVRPPKAPMHPDFGGVPRLTGCKAVHAGGAASARTFEQSASSSCLLTSRLWPARQRVAHVPAPNALPRHVPRISCARPSPPPGACD